ncbi:hypothetical protein C0991_010288 [Blastosporella zonata]|nr:hypothetical protein C0991_010288 [Blastosporella zonata]
MGIGTAVAIGVVPQFVEFQKFKVLVIICVYILFSHAPSDELFRAGISFICRYCHHLDSGLISGVFDRPLSTGTLQLNKTQIQKKHRTGFVQTDTYVDRIAPDIQLPALQTLHELPDEQPQCS